LFASQDSRADLFSSPRAGKQARANEDVSRKNDTTTPDAPQPVLDGAQPPTEPIDIHNALQRVVRDAYSEAPGNGQNRAAQAANAAALHVEPVQKAKNEPAKSRRVDEANQAKLVAEENASKSKFPRYPGLERWDLREKMGDGAFSNVYRARDLQGDYGEVAIKVVRKYEMNNMQVSFQPGLLLSMRCLVISSSPLPIPPSHPPYPHPCFFLHARVALI
jgi:serine/threonine-protein kinase RCK2